jgi:hypothetical protein
MANNITSNNFIVRRKKKTSVEDTFPQNTFISQIGQPRQAMMVRPVITSTQQNQIPRSQLRKMFQVMKLLLTSHVG